MAFSILWHYLFDKFSSCFYVSGDYAYRYFMTNYNAKEGFIMEGTKSLKEVWINYAKFIIQCAEDERLKRDFLMNPRPHLAELGMKIPESIGIVLDTAGGSNRVSLYIKSEEEQLVLEERGDKMTILEEALLSENPIQEIIASRQTKIHELQDKVGQLDKSTPSIIGKVSMTLKKKLEDCEAVLRIPFFDPDRDIFGEVKFADGEELLVTCTC